MKPLLHQILSFIATAFIGLGAGLAAVAFKFGSSSIFHYGIQTASHLPFWLFALIAICLTTGGALVAGCLMYAFAPDAPGSGIPQVKEAYAQRKFHFSWNLLWVKFFGGILSIGTGSSLGREGPTIHIGAAIANKIAGSIKESKEAMANAICAGSAAGLAAAFNSPLAGMTLVLEEVAESQNMDRYAGRCLLASAISVCIVYLFTGDVAALPIGEDIEMKWEILWLSPLVALFAGMIGLFFQWATLSLRAACKKLRLPLWIRPAVGAFVGACLCLFAFAMTSKLGAFGLGEMDLRAALDNQIVWHAAIWLLAAKVLATICCYGSGGCGGIFAPLIFFGGMSGVVVHGMVENWLGFGPGEQTLLSLIGMTACLAAVVRAPLTSILIVFEMTRQIYVLPALMVAAVIAAFINTLFFRYNFYVASLAQDHLYPYSQEST
jgi:CIC family chloride channel protein